MGVNKEPSRTSAVFATSARMHAGVDGIAMFAAGPRRNIATQSRPIPNR